MKLMEHMELSESGKLYCALLFMAYIKMYNATKTYHI